MTQPTDQLRRALIAISSLTARVTSLEGASHEPIAIVGIGCRLPGSVRSIEELWQVLRDGQDLIGPLPTQRGWHTDALFDQNPNPPGKTYLPEGGFIHEADGFDHAFFGMSRHEAMAIDVQQRLLLETSWEAIERAGIDPSSLRGSQTGVFVGLNYTDYGLLEAPDELAAYAAFNSLPSMASGRIAYTFDFHGPALTIDTASSSSLVALHVASQALRQGECSLAVAGGVSVMATPWRLGVLNRHGMSAPNGRCKSFSADADGAGLSEGAGILLLERLSDAKRNGHPILALLRGSAVNQNGTGQALTSPSGSAQERLIEQALDAARLSASDIDVVEAHGMGTALGDTIEAEALFSTYGRAHSKDRPLWLGSLKSNIGHTQAAAGVSSVMKMVLAIQNRLMPKTLHVENPSTHIDWSSGAIQLLNEAVPWSTKGQPRRAAISSFGLNGTNAHLILEEAKTSEPAVSSISAERSPFVAARMQGPFPILVSAKSETALHAQIDRLRDHLRQHPDFAVTDLAFSLATSRSHFSHRAAFVIHDKGELSIALEAFASDAVAPETTIHREATGGKLAFLFTGQGSQRLNMGRSLYEAFPVFRDSLDAAAALLDRHLERPLSDVLFSSDSSASELLDQAAFAESSLFAVEVALFRLLESWGVRPDFLLGHPIGELVAAHVAGVLSLEDACSLVGARARLMQALPGGGAMLAVHTSLADIAPLLGEHGGRVGIAAITAPLSTVLSGDLDPLLEIQRHFEARGITTSRLRASPAFHSDRMDDLLAEFARVARSVSYNAPTIPIVSTVSGTLAPNALLQDPDYWVRNVRQTVRFADGIQALLDLGVDSFLELGPHPDLSPLARHGFDASRRPFFIHSLHEAQPELLSIMMVLAQLHAYGHKVQWDDLFRPLGPKRVDLPTYPFQEERLWLGPPREQGPQAVTSNLTASREPLPRVASAPDFSNCRADRSSSERAELPTLSSARSAGDSPKGTRTLRDLLPFDVLSLPPETVLIRTGIDSVGLAALKSRLATVAGGRTVARRLNPQSQLSDILPFISADLSNQLRPRLNDLLHNDKWTEVSPSSVNKQSKDNVLLSRAFNASSDGIVRVIAELRINPSHPFFYERPVEHVPGLYLIEAARQLENWILFNSRECLQSVGALDRVEVDFLEHVEHNSPAYFVVTRDCDETISPSEAHSADLVQDDRLKAMFSFAGLPL